MSLINQMLKDLEQRTVSQGSVQPISGEVRAVSMTKEFRPMPLVILLVVTLIAGAAAWMYLGRNKPAAEVVIMQQAQLVQAAPPASAVVPTLITAQPTPEPAASTQVRALNSNIAATSAVAPWKIEAHRQSSGLDLRLSPALRDVSHLSVARMSEEKPAKLLQSQPRATLLTSVEDAPSQTVDVPSKAKVQSKLTSTAALAPAKMVSITQQSDNLYRQSVTFLQQGRVAEAQDALYKSLEANARNLKARQSLVGLLVESKHDEEANQLLKDGLKLSPEQSGFSMALARLQVESADNKAARDTLELGLSYAGDDADYHAFYAALLQRDEQHDAAIQHYLTALQTNPAMPTWLVGIGISLQVQGKLNDATAAFQRARDTGQLTPQLTQFVESRLRQIKPAQ